MLPLEEPEAGALIAEVLRAEDIDVRTGVRAERVGHDGHRFAVELGRRQRRHRRDRSWSPPVAAPTRPRSGSTSSGVPADARSAPVDENLRVAPGVWAVGDVTGKGAFTHVAMYQARIAAADILGQPHEPADYRAEPRVTFTDPEVGSVGLTEADARARGLDVAVGRTSVPNSARGWIHKAGNEGEIKLVADAGRGVLVGAMSAGPWGGEVLGLLTLAVHAEVPVRVLREMIYAYPTFHRAIEDALRDLDS